MSQTNTIGLEMHNFAKELWSFNRSLTGEGVRKTLNAISQKIDTSNKNYTFNIHEVKSGTQVFDWIVPKEWIVDEAYIIAPDGTKICDFSKNNLHLMGYSTPIDEKMPLSALQEHLYSLPEQPTAIPYITSYYKERWGFCISQEERDKLKDGEYHVIIKSTLFDGVLNYGEFLIKGKSDKEIFLSTYVCHPSMANNELSGPVLSTYLAKWLLEQENLHYSYRLIFIPETIGSITYLSKHLKYLQNHVHAGFNLTCVGDDRAYSYLPSRNGDTISDRIAKHILKYHAPDFVTYSWNDRGSDERQYCAPHVDLPIASVMRTKYGKFPEYHTSLDDLENVVTASGLQGAYEVYTKMLLALEKNISPCVLVTCEPNMGKRGLYPTLSTKDTNNQVRTMMSLISYSDGKSSLLEIAEKMEVPIWELYDICDTLLEHKLIAVER